MGLTFARVTVGCRRTIARFRRAIASAAPALMRDGAGVTGFGLFVYGAWLVYPPLGFMVAGSMLMGMAYKLAQAA